MTTDLSSSTTHQRSFELRLVEVEAARALRTFLRSEGYAHLYRQIAYGALIAPDFETAVRAADRLREPERSVVRLLALGTSIEVGDLHGPLLTAVCALRRAGMLTREAGTIRTNDWIVVPSLGGYLVTGTPPPYRRSDAIGAHGYIGNDSLMLAAGLAGRPGRRILDLGCGGGVQGLLGVTAPELAVLTDVDEDSLKMAAFNAVLNDVQHRVRVRHGDLYDPVAGEEFDVIVVLPPYVPRVDGSGTTSVVDGGPDGLEFIRRLLRETTEHLAPGGELLAICQLLCDEQGPLLLKELAELCPELQVRISVTNWGPLQPYVRNLTAELAAHGQGASETELLTRYLTSLRAFGATGVCTADIRARRIGEGGAAVVGLAPYLRADSVPAPAALRTGQALDAPTLDLVRAIDGTASIAEITRRAWGVDESSPQFADLVDQAIWRLMALEREGSVSFSSTP